MRRKIPTTGYSVIYADPPWSFRTYSDAGKEKAPDQHYACLDTDALAALPVGAIASPNAALFLWVYQPMLKDAFRVIEAWGFQFKTVAYVWVKIKGGQDRLFCANDDVKKGLGYHTRAGTEQCWLATRGLGYDRLSKGEGQVIFAPTREHSRKPDEVAASIEALTGPVPKIELFARTRRPNWESWGLEVDKFEPLDLAKETIACP